VDNDKAYSEMLEVACQSSQFRFDWWLRSRSAADLQRRCHTLIGLVEKEMASLKEAKHQDKGSRKQVPPQSAAPSHGQMAIGASPAKSKKSKSHHSTEEKERPAKKRKV
jgi:SWI/SNF-related matrix-associated actin-dependent regulator of chromatin subfamily A member 5